MTKLEILKNDIKKLENLAVAFSGGVDSSLLLRVAADTLGRRAVAITLKSPYMSGREIKEAVEFTRTYGIRHEILELEAPEAVKNNPQDRCYVCKKAVFTRLIELAKHLGFTNVADGTNLANTARGLKQKTSLACFRRLKASKNQRLESLAASLDCRPRISPATRAF